MAISKPILEQTLDEYRKQMSVNVDGIVYCAKYAGEVFARQGRGNLIITSSMSAHIVNVLWKITCPRVAGFCAGQHRLARLLRYKDGRRSVRPQGGIPYVVTRKARPRERNQGIVSVPRQ